MTKTWATIRDNRAKQLAAGRLFCACGLRAHAIKAGVGVCPRCLSLERATVRGGLSATQANRRAGAGRCSPLAPTW